MFYICVFFLFCFLLIKVCKKDMQGEVKVGAELRTRMEANLGCDNEKELMSVLSEHNAWVAKAISLMQLVKTLKKSANEKDGKSPRKAMAKNQTRAVSRATLRRRK